MPELKVISGAGERLISFSGEPLLMALLRENGFALQSPCGGKSICGRCAVRASGSLRPAPRDGRCLACQTQVTGDTTVWLGESTELENIALAGALPSFAPDPLPGRYGLAVDIGTTTLALQLLDLRSGALLANASGTNPQRQIADNVIGRIGAAMSGQGSALQSLVHRAIDHLKEEACLKAGISPAMIDRTVITGNTTMLYLYTGRNPACLSRAPFEADHLFGEWVEEGSVYLPPCIGAFLGADLVCALLSSGMCGLKETVLLADIGTNGEIALWHEGVLFCCATAAGPAFEGGGIRSGMGSVPGAIDSVWVDKGGLRFTTIADAPPRGICGSGLIDAAAALLETGRLEESGALVGDEVEIAPEVTLTQTDIRQLQLAKGAVEAGIETLCASVGIHPRDIQRFYIAGGFGSHLNAQNAALIGLIPDALAEKAEALGNAALAGAMMLLLNQGFFPEIRAIADMAHILTLSGNAKFAESFVEGMMFMRIVQDDV